MATPAASPTVTLPTGPVAQRQDSLSEQLDDLYRLAVAHGMYDAADWMQARVAEAAERRARR